MPVAILGTGKMGAALARRLAGTGHELTLWNRNRDAEVVISMLTDANALRQVYTGKGRGGERRPQSGLCGHEYCGA